VEKNLAAITGIFKNSIFSAEYINQKGLLQGLDPRAKFFGLLLLIVAASLTSSMTYLIILYLFSLILAIFSNIRLLKFIKRVWLFIPLFTGVIAIPALFLVPGKTLISFYGIKITQTGLSSASVFVLRVAVSVSFVVSLMLTTRWDYILKALKFFRIPSAFILILSMTYRYIHLLLSIVEDMCLALKSRVITQYNKRNGRSWTAGRIGFVFGRSVRLSGDIHDAMVSRGFDGDVRALDTFRMKTKDILWILLTVGVLSFVILL